MKGVKGGAPFVMFGDGTEAGKSGVKLARVGGLGLFVKDFLGTVSS